MSNLPPLSELEALNQRELRKLVLSVRASSQRLDLLLAICDDRNLQMQLIEAYEAQLRQAGFTPYRALLSNQQPSLKTTLTHLVAHKLQMQRVDRAVVTILGATELLGVRLTSDTSEQEQFFFSLQWTRESLREFQFPIVLWLTDRIATELSKKAPDFWSWRSGVFEFVAQPQRHAIAPDQSTTRPSDPAQTETPTDPRSPAEWQVQITELEQQNPKSPLLVMLYNNLGDAYRWQYAYEPALQAYEQALVLAQMQKNRQGEANVLLNLGIAMYNCTRYHKAIEFYQQSLTIYREISDRFGEARSLVNLGGTYGSLGQYRRSIEYYEQSLAIQREIRDRSVEASSLVGLGNAYYSLGQYQRAIDYYQQSLEINLEIDNSSEERLHQRSGEALSLNNLGNAYGCLGQYQRAIDYHQQSLKIDCAIGNRLGEARSLNNLGSTYQSQGQYQRAIDYYGRSLAIQREIGDRFSEALSLSNLGVSYRSQGQYQQAIYYCEQSLAIQREIDDRRGEAISLSNLGLAYNSLGQYQSAINYYEQSLPIQREIGDRHGEADTLFNLALALGKVDQHFEGITYLQQALAIYQALQIDHKVEDCKKQIATYRQIIAVERRRAPAIGDDAPRRRSRPLSPFWFWVAVGVAAALLIWWFTQ